MATNAPIKIPEIKLELAFWVTIDFKQRAFFKTPEGRRPFVPCAAGEVGGPRLQGRVTPYSGADYATNGQLNAHYMLEATDGTPIYINNMGYLCRTDGGGDRAMENLGYDTEVPNHLKQAVDVPAYFRLTPVFDAPVGPRDWPTCTAIVGTAQRFFDPDHTMFYYCAVL
jgi:Protein of unknown function (DUF3237)